jgi:hypothetical protein
MNYLYMMCYSKGFPAVGARHSSPALSPDLPVPRLLNQQNDSDVAVLHIARGVVEQEALILSVPKGHGWCYLLSSQPGVRSI